MLKKCTIVPITVPETTKQNQKRILSELSIRLTERRPVLSSDWTLTSTWTAFPLDLDFDLDLFFRCVPGRTRFLFQNVDKSRPDCNIIKKETGTEKDEGGRMKDEESGRQETGESQNHDKVPDMDGGLMKKHMTAISALLLVLTLGITAQAAPVPDTFAAPGISAYCNYDSSPAVQLTIYDKSNCAKGYAIYRADNFSPTFKLISQFNSTAPFKHDTLTYNDNSVNPNTWYSYKAAALKDNSSIFSFPCTTFTYHFEKPQQVVKFRKLSEIPIGTNTNCWSAKSGDSIIYKDTLGRYALVNVDNTASPAAAGFLDSETLINYPQTTLIPAFLRFGVTGNFANERAISSAVGTTQRIIICDASKMQMYSIIDNRLSFIDSACLTEIVAPMGGGFDDIWRYTPPKLLLLNDSLIVMQQLSGHYGNTNYAFFTLLIKPFSSSKFSSSAASLSCLVYADWIGQGIDFLRYYRPYIRCLPDYQILLSTDYFGYHWLHMGGPTYPVDSTLTTQVISISKSAIANISFTLPFANAFNTGKFISPSENICTNGFDFDFKSQVNPSGNYVVNEYLFEPGLIPLQIFVADPGDPHPYHTDSVQNAIYTDPTHNQNTLCNILLDTANQRVFLVFKDKLTTLGYYRDSVGVASWPALRQPKQALSVLPGPRSTGVTILLPATSRRADLYFYDLSGRLVDRLAGITSSAVIWRPRSQAVGCYIVSARIGAESYSAKFMVR